MTRRDGVRIGFTIGAAVGIILWAGIVTAAAYLAEVDPLIGFFPDAAE